MTRTKYSTWSPQWSETQHEVFRDFGFSAYTAQMLEASIVQILLAANFRGFLNGAVGAEFDVDAALELRTLGQLKRVMMEEKLIDAGLAEILQDALDARNELMHRFFINNDAFVTDQGRGQMLQQLQELRFRIGKAQMVFSQIREKVYESFFGITKEKALKLYQDHVANKAAENRKER